MVALKAVSAALLAQVVAALRKAPAKAIAGVPIVNYRYRHMQATTGNGEYDWVLKFRQGLGDSTLQAFCGDAGVACTTIGHPTEGGLPIVTMHTSEQHLQKLLEQHPEEIDFVEPDTPVTLEYTEVHDHVNHNGEVWGHETIGLTRSSFTGDGVHIYVMDTGVRTTHEDFEGRAIATIDTIAGRGRVKECNGDASCADDTHGHGTHVAGTAAGKNYGVAKQATIHAMKVCCGSGSNILGGMDWIATYASKPAVMTMSLGSYSTPESSRVAVDAVVNSGVVVTVSAGNANYDSCKKSYTFIASALGVGASDEANARASFSNYGECNAIFAPGVRTVSASHRSNTGSATMSGTSMAAPMVAGVSALLLEQDGSRSPAKVRELLQSRAQAGALTGLKTGDPNLLLSAAF